MLAALLLVWAAMLAARGTPVGRGMRRWLVAWPADRLSRIGRGHVLLVLLLAAGVALVWWAFRQDGLAMLAMGSPELASLLASLEISGLLDVAAAVAIAATAVRWSAVRSLLAARIRRTAGPARRTRAVRRHGPPANDESGPAPLARAA